MQMSVLINLKSNKIELSALRTGEFFKINNKVYLNIYNEVYSKGDNTAVVNVHAFDFESNQLLEFDGSSEVVPLNAKIDLVENTI